MLGDGAKGVSPIVCGGGGKAWDGGLGRGVVGAFDGTRFSELMAMDVV